MCLSTTSMYLLNTSRGGDSSSDLANSQCDRSHKVGVTNSWRGYTYLLLALLVRVCLSTVWAAYLWLETWCIFPYCSSGRVFWMFLALSLEAMNEMDLILSMFVLHKKNYHFDYYLVEKGLGTYKSCEQCDSACSQPELCEEAFTAPACSREKSLAAERTDAFQSRPPKGVYYAPFLNFPKHTPSVSH